MAVTIVQSIAAADVSGTGKITWPATLAGVTAGNAILANNAVGSIALFPISDSGIVSGRLQIGEF